jgi:hypothetical protein
MLLSSILAEFYKKYDKYNRHAGLHSSIPNSQLHADYLTAGHVDHHLDATLHTLTRRAQPHTTFFVVAACLIPVLVLLSGVFAGLTLGYMSLDETQLNVLASSGTA